MINMLLGLGAVNGALGLARNALNAITGGGRKSESYEDIQRAAMGRRYASAGALGSVRADAIGSASAAAGSSLTHRAAAARSYREVMHSQAEGLMRRLDVNGDELLAAAELGLSSGEFSKVDSDGNGDVDVEELARAMQAGRVPTWKA
jgi:hypothetical protein